MTDLLSRLSAAPGPSRELDAEIALACGWTRSGRGLWFDATGEIYGGPPRYSESIAAAMTLVPERASWKLANWFKDGYAADIHLPNGLITRGEGATPALALVIACLKARMEKDNAGQ